jgi:lipopolysaccharide export system protein LptA
MFLLVALAAHGQPAKSGFVQGANFTRYHPPPNFKQVELRLTGERAEQVAGGSNRVNILQPRFIYFRTNGEPLLHVEAPECLFDESDARTRTLSSDAELLLQTGDKRSGIRGRGFQWRQDTMTLVISNDVRAVIQWTNNAAPLEITSDWFEFDAEKNVGRFHENVRGADANQVFTCALLTVAASSTRTNRDGFDLIQADGGLEVTGKQPGQFARAERGTYHRAEERIDLVGAARWEYRGNSGQAEQMTVWMGTTNIDASGEVRLRLPRGSLGAAGNLLSATNRPARAADTNLVSLRADQFTKRGDRLLATGQVRLDDGTNYLTCDRLEGKQATPATPEEFAVATGNVFVGREGGGIYSDRADYNRADGLVVFTGEPRFQQGQAQGAAERVMVRPATSEVQAEGGVKVQLTFAVGDEALLDVIPSPRTNRLATASAKPRTNQVIQVTSRAFVLKENRARFTGGVAAHQLPIDGGERRMTCGEMEILIAADRRHVKRIQARQDVVCERGYVGVTNGLPEHIYSRMESETLTANAQPATGELIDLVAGGGVRVWQAETQATGEAAVFTRATQDLKLQGQSVIDRPEARYTSRQGMTYNLGTGGAVGGYERIELKAAALKEVENLETIRPHE